jgi:hypothetical protein
MIDKDRFSGNDAEGQTGTSSPEVTELKEKE